MLQQKDGVSASPYVAKSAYHAAWSWFRQRFVLSRDDEEEDFDGIIVGHPQAYYLRKHCGGIIGIWCHAVEFAKKEGLHGLFSGMIISVMSEAEEYGVATDKESMDRTNRIMFTQLRRLLDDGIPLHEIPERLKTLDTTQSELSQFNYERFYYL